jgi:hypothetical protein
MRRRLRLESACESDETLMPVLDVLGIAESPVVGAIAETESGASLGQCELGVLAGKCDETPTIGLDMFFVSAKPQRVGNAIVASRLACAGVLSLDLAGDRADADRWRRNAREGPRRRLEIGGVCSPAWDEQKEPAGRLAMAQSSAIGGAHI